MFSDPNEPGFEAAMISRVRNRNFGHRKLFPILGEARLTRFAFTERLLLRHALIIGATGSGKTNHAFHAIDESTRTRKRACLIVDVKREYRRLKGILGEGVQVLAIGDEPRAEFNPLIPPPGSAPGQWDWAFTDVFTRAYGLSEPSRRILLDCLADLREGSKVNPTLRELEGAVADFEAGSPKEQSSRRALESRLHIVNMGSIGKSLNSELPLDLARMEDMVTVYEIGQVGSLRDQRFLAEVMLAQVWENDRARTSKQELPEEQLRRLIVIEEAHRYLSEERPPQQRGDRTLLELAIAEARRYGWGFIIVDQMPLLLSRYVWDNCGTVMMHRLTNLDSYQAVKNALGGDPLPDDNDARGDPIALRLPENVAIFRRYVTPGVQEAGTGFIIVPKIQG
jgi:hypothetical protein